MTTMTFDAETLSTHDVLPTNIILFTGTVGEILSNEYIRTLEQDAEYYEHCTGEEPQQEWMTETALNFDGAYKEFAADLPDILAEAFDELFTTDKTGSAPVYIGDVTEENPHDPAGWGREVVMADMWINGTALKALADEHGITEIHDGHGISGFVRTAADEFWAQIKVIVRLMEEMDPHNEQLLYTLMDWASGDCWLEQFIEYPDEYLKALVAL